MQNAKSSCSDTLYGSRTLYKRFGVDSNDTTRHCDHIVDKVY